MKFLIPLFWPLVCVAQLPVIPFITHANAGVIQSLNPALWWVFTDTTNGGVNSPVASWVDRIQGVVLKNDDTTRRPTNSAVGIGFGDASADRWLTNQPVTLTSNITMVVIGTCTKGSVSNPNSGVFSALDKFSWGFNNAAAGLFGVAATGSSSANFNFNGGNLVLSNRYDLAWVSSNQPPQQSKAWFYTNGIVDNNGNTVNPLYGGSNFVMAATGHPVAVALGQFTCGYELELIIFTNVLTPSQIATVHTYATTTYP